MGGYILHKQDLEYHCLNGNRSSTKHVYLHHKRCLYHEPQLLSLFWPFYFLTTQQQQQAKQCVRQVSTVQQWALPLPLPPLPLQTDLVQHVQKVTKAHHTIQCRVPKHVLFVWQVNLIHSKVRCIVLCVPKKQCQTAIEHRVLFFQLNPSKHPSLAKKTYLLKCFVNTVLIHR